MFIPLHVVLVVSRAKNSAEGTARWMEDKGCIFDDSRPFGGWFQMYCCWLVVLARLGFVCQDYLPT